MTARKKAEGHKVARDGVVSNGNGGFFKKGDPLPEGADFDSLKAKGYAE